MKKIFTLIATALIAIGANAQKWTVSDADVEATTIASGTTLYSDAKIAFTTKSDAVAKKLELKDADENPITLILGGITFNNFTQIRTKNNVDASNPDGDTQEDCMSLLVKVTKDTDVTIYYRRQAVSSNGEKTYAAQDGKDLKCFNKTKGEAISGELTVESYSNDAKDYGYSKQVFKLFAGYEYTFWAKGTTIQLYGIDTADGTSGEVKKPENIYEFTSATTNSEGFSAINYEDGSSLVLVGNAEKSYTKGNDIKIGDFTYATTKLSNGAQNKFNAPSGKKIYSVKIISYVNADSGESYWNEINNVETKEATNMTSFKNTANPDSFTFSFGTEGVDSFTFTNKGKQLAFILEVNYNYDATIDSQAIPTAIKNVETTTAASVKKSLRNGQIVIETANGTFNAVGAQVK